MAIPTAREVRRYFFAGRQRYDDAMSLLENGRTTGAVYLSGYAVECFLKVLILSGSPESHHHAIIATFRGLRAHNLEWLKMVYLKRGGPPFPRDVRQDIRAIFDAWSTDLRYEPGMFTSRDARQILQATERVIDWIARARI